MTPEPTADLIWTEHPAWQPAGRSRVRVVAGHAVTVTGNHAHIEPLIPEPGEVRFDWFTLPDLGGYAPELSRALGGLGTVTRVRTTDLWEATAAAILRDHLGAYRDLTETLGRPTPLPDGNTWRAFPVPEAVHAQPLDRLTEHAGQAAPVLRMAATVYTRCGPTWTHSTPDTAITALQTLPGVDEATARHAITDITGDHTHYPLTDPPLRAWAIAASPRVPWPRVPEKFPAYWSGLAHGHLHDLTGLLAAWAWRTQPFRPPWHTRDTDDPTNSSR